MTMNKAKFKKSSSGNTIHCTPADLAFNVCPVYVDHLDLVEAAERFIYHAAIFFPDIVPL